jgi:hypothetical protein
VFSRCLKIAFLHFPVGKESHLNTGLGAATHALSIRNFSANPY